MSFSVICYKKGRGLWVCRQKPNGWFSTQEKNKDLQIDVQTLLIQPGILLAMSCGGTWNGIEIWKAFRTGLRGLIDFATVENLFACTGMLANKRISNLHLTFVCFRCYFKIFARKRKRNEILICSLKYKRRNSLGVNGVWSSNWTEGVKCSLRTKSRITYQNRFHHTSIVSKLFRRRKSDCADEAVEVGCLCDR